MLCSLEKQLLLVNERLLQQFSCSCSFLRIRNKALQEEIFGNFRHFRWDFGMNFVETHFEHSSLRCTFKFYIIIGKG